VSPRSELPTAVPFLPAERTEQALRAAVEGCRGCPIYANATRAVFGEGPVPAELLLVGEQPGDQEDRRGLPFVGPAGKLLDRALEEAGIDRGDAYVTNSVKHFKFTSSGPGKRRIHAKPDAYEIAACSPWLTAELSLLDPEMVVALGATAARALFGPAFRVTRQRGVLLPWPEGPAADSTGDGPADRAGDGTARAGFALATIHPSAVLRADDRDTAYAGLVADLRVAAGVLA
jgi:uracil-DNA glycosylase family protein